MTDHRDHQRLGRASRAIGILLGGAVFLGGALALLTGRELFYGAALLALGGAGIVAGLTGRVPKWFRN